MCKLGDVVVINEFNEKPQEVPHFYKWREFCSRFKKGEIDLITQGKNDIMLLVEAR